ncbi:MAG: RNA polymerase factor sigma-54 [Pseudomonadales bacterium]|nr:RNA polymerase factor sigma-54 [Pseudomonadales bacterium]
MKQTLALKLGQQLTMTPQLQQAIRLLQLSALDLQEEIQATLESNPMLEVSEELPGAELDATQHEQVQAEIEERASSAAPDADTDTDTSTQLEAPIRDELPTDTDWEAVYPTNLASSVPDADYDPFANQTEAQTLADHLLWQLNLSTIAESDRIIAEAIIDGIDTNGMLTVSIDEIYESLATDELLLSSRETFEQEHVLEILDVVQQLDPVGVAARDLQECLLLQIKQYPSGTPWVNEAIMLLEEHMDLLGSKDYNTLKRKTRMSEDDLGAAMTLIRTLDPRPGSTIADQKSDYIEPDVIVRKFEGQWVVELNSDVTPQIRINSEYEDLAKSVTRTEDRDYLRENLQEARWFLKSLQTRHDTLLRVAAKIIEVQKGFLDYGPEAMKPLILADIASAVDLHESTISRVTSRKYLATPRGVFELKYFFSSHVGTNSGGEVSSTAIRALIQKLTAEEDPKKPLSDNKIAAILKDQNIKVARRTVAKYRESLSIPPSNERKQLV